MPVPPETAVEDLRNALQILDGIWGEAENAGGEHDTVGYISDFEGIERRVLLAIGKIEQLQKDKDLYERLYHEYEARDQLDQDHADYVGSAFPTREAMRGVQPVDYPLQQTDLTAEERSHRVAGQPISSED